MTGHVAILFFATLLDRFVGDPDAVWRRIPHPVVIIGNVISLFEERLNGPTVPSRIRRRNGLILAITLVLGATFLGLGLSSIFAMLGPIGVLCEIAVLSIFLAQKSLIDHVEAVRDALAARDLESARFEVAKIVGRDVSSLDETGVSRAAIESLAENTSDGVVAPFLWYLVLGLPGVLVYKAVNTADSMIGHLNERYSEFGWASARLDDVLNALPARLTAWALIRVAKFGGKVDRADAMGRVKDDAKLHRSPNAGWPEAAMALGLDLALGGPRRYGALAIDAPFLNSGGRYMAGPDEIAAALRLTRKLFNRLLLVSGVLMLVFAILG